MSNKNQIKNNKKYLENKGLVNIQFTDLVEVDRVYEMATSFYGVTKAEPLRKAIRKFNAKFINQYGHNKSN